MASTATSTGERTSLLADAQDDSEMTDAGARENFNCDDVQGRQVENIQLERFVQQVQFRSSHQGFADASIPKTARVSLLNYSDKDAMVEHCRKWFPVSYPPEWYDAVTKFYSKYFSVGVFDTSVAAAHDSVTRHDRLIAFIVTDIKPVSYCLMEDLPMVKSDWPQEETLLAYIMVIGVDERYRRLGLATFLLQCLLDYLREEHMRSCRAIYLHVLSTNAGACQFYCERGFRRLALLNNYYVIDGQQRDAYLYAMYINDPVPVHLNRRPSLSHDTAGAVSYCSAAVCAFFYRMSAASYLRRHFRGLYTRTKQFFRRLWRAVTGRNHRQSSSSSINSQSVAVDMDNSFSPLNET